MNIKNLLDRLSKFHWSPEHPSYYVIIEADEPKGIGKIAHKNYGAFNLAWGAVQGQWQTHKDQLLFVGAFSKYSLLTSYEMGSQTVGDWACMLQPADFISQLQATPLKLPSMTRELLGVADRALNIETKNDI